MRLPWVLLALAGAAACARPTDEDPPTPDELRQNPERVVVARIGETRYTASDLLSALGRRDAFAQERYRPAHAKLAWIESFVDFEVLVREAIARGLHRAPAPTRALKAALALALWEKGRLPGVDRSMLTEDRLRAYHRAHGSEFLEPERARVSHILIRRPPGRPLEARAAARARAERVRAEIGDRIDAAGFAELARRHSDDEETRERGGDLGLVARGETEDPRFPAEVVRAAFALEPGQVSGLVESQQGIHLLRVQARYPARPARFRRVRKQVEARLWRELRREGMRRLVAELEARARVEVDARQARALGETSRWIR